MSIEKYLNEVAAEGLFFNKTPKEYAKIEKTINDLFSFGKTVETTIDKLGIHFYPTLKASIVPNKITPKNELIEQFKKIYDDGHHSGFVADCPVLTWKVVKSKENDVKSEFRHLYQRLTKIIDFSDPGTAMVFGHYRFSVDYLSDKKDHIALFVKTHHTFIDKH
jgi:hypothetical protein